MKLHFVCVFCGAVSYFNSMMWDCIGAYGKVHSAVMILFMSFLVAQVILKVEPYSMTVYP